MNAIVKLRAIEPEDIELLYDIENDTQLWSVGATNVPYSRFALSNFIATSSSDVYADKQVRMMIDDAEGNTVGMVDLVNFDPRHLRAEVGIVIKDEHRGRGFAKAALLQVADYARQTLHLCQLYAIVNAENVTSVKLFQSVGFVLSATLKKWLNEGDKWADAVLMQIFF